MRYKVCIFILVFVFVACGEDESKNKTDVEKCVEGVSNYWACLVSLKEKSDNSPEKQQCDNQVVQYADAQDLLREKMSKVMEGFVDKVFANFSRLDIGGVAIDADADLSENCKKKQSDLEKKECMIQEYIELSCQEELSE